MRRSKTLEFHRIVFRTRLVSDSCFVLPNKTVGKRQHNNSSYSIRRYCVVSNRASENDKINIVHNFHAFSLIFSARFRNEKLLHLNDAEPINQLWQVRQVFSL